MLDIEHWKVDIKDRANSLHKELVQLSPLYGGDALVPERNEVLRAFALCLPDIGRYCLDNYIKVRNIDTVKLMAFAIPHLLSIRSRSLSIDLYALACIHIIHANGQAPEYTTLISTTQVMKHLCLKFPSQYNVVYGYLKGYQESLEFNSYQNP